MPAGSVHRVRQRCSVGVPAGYKELAEETRVRRRYLDLIVRDAADGPPACVGDTDRTVRETLHSLDFVEAATPMR